MQYNTGGQLWIFQIDVLNDSGVSVIDANTVTAVTDYTDTGNPTRDITSVWFDGNTGALYSTSHKDPVTGIYAFCGINNELTVNFSTAETVSKVQIYLRQGSLIRASESQIVLIKTDTGETKTRTFASQSSNTNTSDTNISTIDYYLEEHSYNF